MIKRDFCLNQLIAKRHSSKIKIIIGLRRSGKSYLLTNIYKQHLLSLGVEEKQIIIISLDDEENDALIKVPNSFKKIMVLNKPFLSYHDEKVYF